MAVSRSIVIPAGGKTVAGQFWPAQTLVTTDDGWAELLLGAGCSESGSPSAVYVRGDGWYLGGKRQRRAVARSIVVASPINVHGVVWPAATYVLKDDGHAELLLAKGATESAPPSVTRTPGTGWDFS